MKTTVSRAIGVALFGLVAGLMLASVASGASTSEPRDGSTIRLAAAYAPAGFVQVDPPTLVIGGGSSPPDVNPPEAKSFHVKAKRVKKLLNRVVKLRKKQARTGKAAHRAKWFKAVRALHAYAKRDTLGATDTPKAKKCGRATAQTTKQGRRFDRKENMKLARSIEKPARDILKHC